MRIAARPRQTVLVVVAILGGLAVAGVLWPDGFPARSLSYSAVRLISFYQRSVRPLLGNHIRCRLHPTCSNFANQEFSTRSFLDASVAVTERLILCARAAPEAGTALPGLAMLMQGRAQDQAAVATCCAGFGFLIFLIIALIALSIVLLVWVARDAKNRGVDNPVLWMILVFFTGIIGLIIYLAVRPSGNLIQCEHCPNKKLVYATACPHCGKPDTRTPIAR